MTPEAQSVESNALRVAADVDLADFLPEFEGPKSVEPPTAIVAPTPIAPDPSSQRPIAHPPAVPRAATSRHLAALRPAATRLIAGLHDTLAVWIAAGRPHATRLLRASVVIAVPTATFFLTIWIIATVESVEPPPVSRPIGIVGAPPRVPPAPQLAMAVPRTTTGGIAAVERKRPERSARPFTGTVAVRSTPTGARVLIDRRPIGQTPLGALHLRAGSHVIWIERAGYQRWTGAVNVPANKQISVAVMLRPNTRK